MFYQNRVNLKNNVKFKLDLTKGMRSLQKQLKQSKVMIM